jgi:hypothetical protein
MLFLEQGSHVDFLFFFVSQRFTSSNKAWRFVNSGSPALPRLAYSR